MKQKKLKDFDFDPSSLIKTTSDSKFVVKQVVYSRLHDCYATIVKIDAKEQDFICKLRYEDGQESEEAQELTIKAQDLTNEIRVLVHTQGDEAMVAEFTVDINDKICETVLDLCQASFDQLGAVLLHKGSQVSEDDTFSKLSVKSGSQFSVIASGKVARVTPIPWRRSKFIQNDSFTHGSSEHSDALTFKAKVNVVVYGFMWNKDYEGKDWTIQFRYRVDDGEPSEWTEVTQTPADIVTEDKNHFVDFQDYGLQGVPLNEGQRIEFAVKNPTQNQFCYIYRGYEETYSSIEGQEFHFMTDYSDWNQNCTDSDWGFFPGLLYLPA